MNPVLFNNEMNGAYMKDLYYNPLLPAGDFLGKLETAWKVHAEVITETKFAPKLSCYPRHTWSFTKHDENFVH